MELYKHLLKREADGNPIRLGLVGCGQMGSGLVHVTSRMAGLNTVAISDIDVNRPLSELRDMGIPDSEICVTSNAGDPVVVPVTLLVGGTGVDDRIPEAAVLYGNFPNPFGPSTRVAFSIPTSSGVELSIYSVDGRLVRNIPESTFGEGRHTISWDGRDRDGRRLPAGVYFYRLQIGREDMRGKMVMIH